ncbi:NnrU family protein [Cucumibacter marinus]|uniref:NnrU family protein n=1 Tax=Cucumibacter marinus TaxID=1121252 RepID=UPI00048C9923|nr:NnrU family protein [Cucumibacter marinus]
MAILIIGVVLFFGAHSVRMVAPGFRDAQISGRGEATWKGLYALVSLIGIVLIGWGWAMWRPDAAFLYEPPGFMRHITSLLVTLGFIGIFAAYLPMSHIKARLKHPFIIGIALWALGHALANGDLASLVLFGVFLVYSVIYWFAANARPVTEEPEAPQGRNDLGAIFAGVISSIIFVVMVHGPLIGVAPFG